MLWDCAQPREAKLRNRSRCHYLSFPGGTSAKESGCQCRRCKRHQFYPWMGKILWRRKCQTTPVLLPGKSHGQRSLVGYSPWGHKESDTPEHAHRTDCVLLLRIAVCLGFCHLRHEKLICGLTKFTVLPVVATWLSREGHPQRDVPAFTEVTRPCGWAPHLKRHTQSRFYRACLWLWKQQQKEWDGVRWEVLLFPFQRPIKSSHLPVQGKTK